MPDFVHGEFEIFSCVWSSIESLYLTSGLRNISSNTLLTNHEFKIIMTHVLSIPSTSNFFLPLIILSIVYKPIFRRNTIFKKKSFCLIFFLGVGMGMVVLMILSAIEYHMILAWTLHYFGSSFISPLPWSDCTHEWNSAACRDKDVKLESNSSLLNYTKANDKSVGIALDLTGNKSLSPEEDYWQWVA